MKLPFAQKIARFQIRFRDPEWRHYGASSLTGKLVGVALLLAAIYFFNSASWAAGSSPPTRRPR